MRGPAARDVRPSQWERITRDRLIAGDETEVHRHADVVPAVGLVVHAEVVVGRRQVRKCEVFEGATEALLDQPAVSDAESAKAHVLPNDRLAVRRQLSVMRDHRGQVQRGRGVMHLLSADQDDGNYTARAASKLICRAEPIGE